MEDDQQFCLRWNNHQSTLVAVFDTLLENGTLVDCTLAAEGKYLNAHKVVLSACSPYFESLLSQNYDKHPIFILKDVKFQELKAMMDYMYRGEVNISQDQLGALLKAAESLQIKGLSDNKKESEPRKSAPPAPAKSPPPAASTNLPRVQGLTIEQRRGNRSMDEREGSLSPGPRKRKRMRRRSTDDLDNHHDASNSSESHSNPPIQNIPIALPPAPSKLTNADVPEPVETKSEILSRHKISSNNDSEIPQVPIIKEKLETHTELMLEPKAEYVEEMNEDSIEDLTLDDDDVSNLDMSNDGAGPSHGNAGEGSSQGFGGWHMGNQSQDEVFLAAQEAVGAHRDSQDIPRTWDVVFWTNQEVLNYVPSRWANSTKTEYKWPINHKPGQPSSSDLINRCQDIDNNFSFFPVTFKKTVSSLEDAERFMKLEGGKSSNFQSYGHNISGSKEVYTPYKNKSNLPFSHKTDMSSNEGSLHSEISTKLQGDNSQDMEGNIPIEEVTLTNSEKYLVQIISGLRMEVKELTKTVNRLETSIMLKQCICNKSTLLVENEIENFLINILPAKSKEDFDVLEEKVTSTDSFNALVEILYLVGGDNYKSAVYGSLKKLFVPEVAQLYSGQGRNRCGQKKESFGALKVCDALKKAIRKRFPSVTDTELKDRISTFLCTTKDRSGMRKYRTSRD